MVHCAFLGILKGMKKCNFYFLSKYNVREMQNKKPFEIILHVGRVTSLQSWVAKKSCHDLNVLFLTTLPTLKAFNSPYMQYYFKRFFILHSSEVIFSFLIKKSRQKAIEIETAFFHSLENPEGCTLDHFLCFTYPS